MLEKRAKKDRQQRDKAEKQRLKDEKTGSRRSVDGDDDHDLYASTNTQTNANAIPIPTSSQKPPKNLLTKPPKPPRDRKFCVLPPKTPSPSGEARRDACWVRVFMEGVDEVGAHTGLFFVGRHYERLVGDVGERIEGWVREAESVRLVGSLEGR